MKALSQSGWGGSPGPRTPCTSETFGEVGVGTLLGLIPLQKAMLMGLADDVHKVATASLLEVDTNAGFSSRISRNVRVLHCRRSVFLITSTNL